MSFFATGKDYKKQNLKTRPTKGIPKFRKKRKAPKCGLCQFHVIAYEKKDYKVEKSYNHFKKASEI